MNNMMYNPAYIGGTPVSSFASPTWNARSNVSDYPVNGIESVKSYPMTPNSRVILFDANEDIFYCKETDVSNYPTIRIFKFEEVKTPEAKSSEYVTLNEFNKFKEEVLDGQQHIREHIESLNRPSTQDNEYTGAKSESSTNASKLSKSKPSV